MSVTKKSLYVLTFLLTLFILIFATTKCSFAASDDTTFDVKNEDGTHITGAMIIGDDGKAHHLSEEEYLAIRNSPEYQNTIDDTPAISQVDPSDLIEPFTMMYYKFVPTKKRKGMVQDALFQKFIKSLHLFG